METLHVQPSPAGNFSSPVTEGSKNGEQHCRDSVNSSKAEEIGDVRGWPSNIFINIWHQEIKVSNGEGEPSLQKTAGSAYRQQRPVSETYAISSHNKSIINASI